MPNTITLDFPWLLSSFPIKLTGYALVPQVTYGGCLAYAAFTPPQHVVRQQVTRTSNLLRATSNMLRATSCLLPATCCLMRATSCLMSPACFKQHVARNKQLVERNLLPHNMLRWCKRGFRGNPLVSINAVALRRVRLVLGWVTVRGYTILVFNQAIQGY